MKTRNDANALTVAKAEALVFRVPIEHPVTTSFGTMHSRPAVVVRIEDADGAVGWGEIWCNFPAVGAEHRARLFQSVIAPLLREHAWASPDEMFAVLSRRLHVLALQTGEDGPIAQVVAGANVALWDLMARRVGQPLWRLLGGQPEIAVYASGLNPDAPERLAVRKQAQGYRAFKLKVGFGSQRDVGNLKALRAALGDEATLMVDANQAWGLEEALDAATAIAPFGLRWLEEPMPVDALAAAWARLAAGSAIPLAGGENIRGTDGFSAAIAVGSLRVIQPDIGKWGGFSGCLEVGRQALAAGRLFCPHWLGGGVGQVASMHLKAAIGGDGFVEVDANDNPLRELLGAPFPVVRDGRVTLSEDAGLGIEPDLAILSAYRVAV
jgi:L-alanine-DL-glutamate epimerase-like enolase superfamily enzyme